MELPMAAAIAVLFAAGSYSILRPNLIRVVMGFSLYANAANLLLITMGGYTRQAAAPFVGDGAATRANAPLMDPLPPDIILTAIVISFAVGALLLIVCYRLYLDTGSDDPGRLDDAGAGEAGARQAEGDGGAGAAATAGAAAGARGHHA